jgi:PAS domain S-box-containing protein
VVMGVYRPVQKDRVWLLVNAEPAFDTDGKMDCVICTFSDITAKKQIEEQNIAQLRRYKMLLHTSQDAIFILDESGCIQEWNEAFLSHLGYTEEEIKGRHIWDWDKDQRWDPQFSDKIFASVDERGIAYESMHQKKDGSFRNVDIRLHRFTINGINSYYASARDITENKRTEKKIKELNEELRALAVYMQNLIEKERSAIAKEIHDEFAQNFVALNMNAVWLKSKLKHSDESIQQVLNEQMNIANIVINTSRKIFNALHPSMLDELGLIAAISWYMKTYQKLANINFELDSNIEEEKLSIEINLVLFRIFQECLTNISRYAKATKVRASIIKRKNSITMDIQDDGIGFDVAAVDAKTHHGLLVMRERIHAIDGKIRIDSSPGKGTSVQVELPLA